MCRLLQKQQLTVKKKPCGAAKPIKKGQKKKRREYWEKIRHITPENIVFLDAMGVLLGMMRHIDRSKKGERVCDIKPFYY
jgi:hypothetical protein